MGVRIPRGVAGRRGRIGIVLVYALVGSAWIVFSDQALAALGPEAFRVLSPIKGAAYVAVTGAIVWLLMLVRDERIERHRADLAASEERYRMLAERSQDVVYRMRLGPVAGFEYVSPAITSLSGFTPEEQYAHPELSRDFLPEEMRASLAAAASPGAAEAQPLTVRLQRPDGRILWIEHRVSVIRDPAGMPVAVEGVARDVTARIDAEQQRAVLLRAIETAPVGIVLHGGAETGYEVTYANDAVARLTGLEPEQIVGHSAFQITSPSGPDRSAAIAQRMAAGDTFEIETPGVARQDGTMIPLSIMVAPLLADGGVSGMLEFISDRSEAEGRRRAEASLGAALAASPMAIVAVDAAGTVTAWNPAAEDLLGWTAEEAIGRALPYLDGEAGPATAGRASASEAGPGATYTTRPFRRADGTSVLCTLATGVIRDADGRATGSISLISDLTESLRREDWSTQLRRAIDHAAESVVITDLAGSIVYANPAFEAVSGYSLDELLGRNPRILKSGLTPPSVYEEMWRTLTVGGSWRGVLVNRRKDGSLFEEECTFSAVLGHDGQPTGFVGVKRDLTLERRLAAGLSSELLDRAAVEDAMAGIVVHRSPEETAGEFCAALASFGEVTDAWLVALPRARASVITVAAAARTVSARPGTLVPDRLAAYIRERAQHGPWSDNHRDDVDPRAGAPGLEDMVVVAAPVRSRGRVVGVLFAAARPGAPEAWVARHLRIVSELATHAGPTLGPQLDEYEPAEIAAAEIRAVIDGRRLTPVFQPICDLVTRQVAGWEALTRFDDAEPPARRFAQARTCGLDGDLELACGRAAISAFASLAGAGWLSLNVSPSLIASGRAELLLAGLDRPVVLELTERVPIDDFVRVRGAIDLLQPQPWLAVGDAGDGYASLRRVLELRPDFVKLDAAFVHGIDLDASRQAMAAGALRYAREHGAQLIAQGIETEAERTTLVRLGVALGQGFLLGVPSASGAVTPVRRGDRAGDRRLRSLDASDPGSSAAG
jgi:PAS domain S-box-containing protein